MAHGIFEVNNHSLDESDFKSVHFVNKKDDNNGEVRNEIIKRIDTGAHKQWTYTKK